MHVNVVYSAALQNGYFPHPICHLNKIVLILLYGPARDEQSCK